MPRHSSKKAEKMFLTKKCEILAVAMAQLSRYEGISDDVSASKILLHFANMTLSCCFGQKTTTVTIFLFYGKNLWGRGALNKD